MKSGAYRDPIAQGLKDHDPKLSRLIADGSIKLAITSGIQGPVTVRRDLTALCIEGLERAGEQFREERAYYIDGLKTGRFVPVSTYGVDYIAVGTSAEDAVAKQQAVLDNVPERHYAPGELFFRS